ncbi:MAG: DMT family transporter [Tannerella sp.]|jgi:drug/metabolite transporter (DMT)-like permease|nr:DMT family transporter [Tannerella sp.]
MDFWKNRYYLFAFFVVGVWGVTFISTKFLLLAGLSPEDIFFYRFGLAYIGIWFTGKNRLFAKNWKDEFIFLLVGITGGSVYFLAENFALEFTQTSNVAFIVCTAPLVTAVLSHIFLKNEKLNRRLIQGSILALVGVALVVFNGKFILHLNPAGDLLSFLAAISWAFYTILLKQVSNRYPMLFITRKVFFYGLLTILPTFLIHPLTTDTGILFQPVVYLNLLFLGIVASLLCYFFWNLVIKQLGAVRATNYVYIVPVITLIASSLFLDETITVFAVTGMLFTLAGVVWAGRGSRLQN